MCEDPAMKAGPYIDAIGQWNRWNHGQRVNWCHVVFSMKNDVRQKIWIGISVTYGHAVAKEIHACYNQVNRPENTKQEKLEA